MYRPTSLLNKWVQENNELVTKWKVRPDNGLIGLSIVINMN